MVGFFSRARTCTRWAAGFCAAGLLTTFEAHPGRADVVSPFKGMNLEAGSTHRVEWDPIASCATVDIELYQGRTFVDTIAPDVPDSGTFDWDVLDYGLGPACNYTLRIGCGGSGTVSSDPFAIGGLLLVDAVPGDRTVTLRWRRSPADTLGASNLEVGTTPGNRAFAGYSVWRRTYDNLLNPVARDRFAKIRAYDVQVPLAEESPIRYDFPSEQVRYGPVTRQVDEDTQVTETWQLAQSFTTPAAGVTVCGARLFLGDVLGRWNTRLMIVPMAGGVPDLDNPIVSRIVAHGGAGTVVGGQAWLDIDSLMVTPGGPVGVALAGDESFALVVGGSFETVPALVNWTNALYDAYPGGTRFRTKDNGATWESSTDEEGDFAFVISAREGSGPCHDWIGQRFGGEETRNFNDPASIRAFVFVPDDETGAGQEGEEPEQTLLDAQGPFNGFQVEYAVTAFDRVVLTSSNIEFISACEDTLVVHGVLQGVQPNEASAWPEPVIPRSNPKTRISLLSDVYPVPNPYIRDPNSPSYPRWELPGELRIDFVNLPTEATIRIYTLAGDHVRDLQHREAHGTESWDLRNASGEIVDSGVYLWLIRTPSGERKTGQLVIVR